MQKNMLSISDNLLSQVVQRKELYLGSKALKIVLLLERLKFRGKEINKKGKFK